MSIIQVPFFGEFNFGGSEPSSPYSDLETLTEDGKNTNMLMAGYYNRRLIEDVNFDKYIIDGEKAGSFTFGDSTKDTNSPLSGGEYIYTIYNGDCYIFYYIATAEKFDDPKNTAVRTYMFESIKLSN